MGVFCRGRARSCSPHYTFRVRRKPGTLNDASRRALFGAKLATLAVLSGAVATAVSVLAVAYAAVVGSTAPPSPADVTRLASHREPTRTVFASIDEERDSGMSSTKERNYGSLVVIDVPPNVASLDDELERQRTLADVSGQRMLLWLVVTDCKPCTAVEAAFSSLELQRALARARIVRLNAIDFGAELSRLGLSLDAFPGFALLGADGHATDYLHGGEWDADTPQNIAPVLKSFVDGTYARRRSPWHGGPHADETAI